MNGYDALLGMSEMDADLIYEAETVKKRRAVYAWRWAVAAAALILCMGITVPVMAMTGNEKVYEILYMISPELAQKLKPVNMSCEDDGILMTVVAADVHDDRAEVLISLKDLTDNRLDGTTDLFDSYSIHTPYDQSGGCSLAGFDEESGELIYMISVEQMDHVLIPGDKITFSISQLLTGKKHFELSIDQIDTANLPVIMEYLADPNFRGYSGSDIEDGMQIIIPGEEVLLDEGVTLTGYGLVDGQLHVQIKYDDIYHTDNHGFLYLEKEDTDRVLYAGSYAFWDESHTDSYEEYVFDIPAEELQEYRLGGEFWTCTGGPIEGDWSVTFPLSWSYIRVYPPHSTLGCGIMWGMFLCATRGLQRMIIKMSNPDILSKTGRDLLPEETLEYFKEIRSINYYNVLNKTLSEYTFAEWYVCLDEKVLLEQCLPRYSEKLDMDPLMPGLFSKGEILYKITLIDKAFWIDHPDWYEYFRTIIHGVLDLGKEELINKGIREEYIEVYFEAYRGF